MRRAGCVDVFLFSALVALTLFGVCIASFERSIPFHGICLHGVSKAALGLGTRNFFFFTLWSTHNDHVERRQNAGQVVI